VELAAVVRAFEKFQYVFSISTDSAYVAGIVTRIKENCIKEVTNPLLFSLLLHLQSAVQLCIPHVLSHTGLPGPTSEGNACAEHLAGVIMTGVCSQEYLSCGFFHQSAAALQKPFQLAHKQAQEIAQACANCPPLPALRVNP
ncbi:POK7 protein, partial [Horornis vulcanius]|nr:POK7 protein [Horornis vulcanius]